MNMERKKKFRFAGVGVACIYAGMRVLAVATQEKESLDGDNSYLNIQETTALMHSKPVYERVVKPTLDSVLSFCGMIALLPVYAITAAAVYIDDPGPVFFSQKRIGKNKHYFMLHKFRTMKMSAPHDMPTHLLGNPEQYITGVGRVIRRYSIDELPQLWDVFRHKMSLTGPRPALWNQADLVAEREKYGANSVMPGITGLAQISGRDELSIEEKAWLDGEYAKAVSFGVDVKCLLGTIRPVWKADGVIEGGAGEAQRRLRPGVPAVDPETDMGFKKTFHLDSSQHKRVLITGAGSYIGEYFKSYACEHYGNQLEVNTLSMRGNDWRMHDFSSYDTVYHVAGIAHADVGNVDEKTKEKYYLINTDLAIETAKKAKADGVKQFIFMSSIIIYGGTEYIDEGTKPSPVNFYGDSKWQADKGVRALADKYYHVATIRAPMIYGKGSKGNYQKLASLAKKTPIFPDVDSRRSMLYIENLCEFLCKLILSGEGGVFFPQNDEYTRTSQMVNMIAQNCGHKVMVSGALGRVVRLACYFPGEVGAIAQKVFGGAAYDSRLSDYGFKYRLFSLEESIRRTER